MMFLDEHHSSGEGFWGEYLTILMDPAHLAAELTFTLMDILILTPLFLLVFAGVKRWMATALQREHIRLDAEHGISHEAHALGSDRLAEAADCSEAAREVKCKEETDL